METGALREHRRLILLAAAAALLVTAAAVGGPLQQREAPVTFNYNVHLFVNGINVNGWTVDSCPGSSSNQTGPWVCSIITNGVVENNTLTFAPGQKVLVNVWFEYLKKPVDPPTITLDSVTAGAGFRIESIAQSIPFEMRGWGAQSGVVALLDILPAAHSGSIDLYANFTT